MRVLLQNHQEYQSIFEILRLFFRDISKPDGQIIHVTDDQYSDLVLFSNLEYEVTKDQMGDKSNQKQVLVSSKIEDTSLMVEAVVTPSAIRRELKRQTYYLLSNLCQIYYPWGSLTGIRPTQIVYRRYQANQYNFDLTKRDLIENWYLTPEKAEIGLKTAIEEMKIINYLQADLPMLYIGIPFCTTRCAYCSFITQDAVKQTSELSIYIDALLKEIKEISAYFYQIGKSFQAIYVGGGTPTALPEIGFAKLIHAIKTEIPQIKNCEITIEAGRPDSITEAKLAAIRSLNNARICINPQTMHDQTLVQIGRHHTVEQVYKTFASARKFQFDSINMDLILGLPGEKGEDFLDSLKKILCLSPESITIHTMALKRSAFLEENYSEHYLKLRFPDSDLSFALAEAIRILKNHAYHPYYMYRQKNVRGGLENIGFAKAGHACSYNVGMMSDQISIVGLGSGSSTKIVYDDKIDRLYNPKNLVNYAQRIDEMIERKKTIFNLLLK